VYPVTCLEYTKRDDDIATRPLKQLLADIKLTDVPTYYNNGVINCNRDLMQYNMRLKLPFTIPIITYDSCSANELVSLINRHLVTNEAMVAEPKQQLLWYLTYMHYLRIRPPTKIKTYTPQQVVLSKKPAKRKQYRQALISLSKYPLNNKDYIIKMFIKNERMDLKDPPKPPRAIQSRTPRYNICYQQYTLAYSNLWCTPLYQRVCTKGLNQYEIADWIQYHWSQYDNPVADLLDHRFYDAKEHTLSLIYQNMYMFLHFDDIDYLTLMQQRLSNHCVTRNGIKYRVKGTRMSGEADTSDGNSTINDMMLAYVYRKVNHSRCLLGDDSVVIHSCYDNVDLTLIQSYGFQTKLSQVSQIESIEYCQCHPVKTINGWLMVRDPLRVISRGTVCINHSIKTVEMFKRWCRGVGECEYSCNAGVPVLQSFAKFMLRATNDQPIYDEAIEYHKISGKYNHQISDESRISFNNAFSITPQQQRGLEDYFDHLSWDEVKLTNCHEPSFPTMSSL
jgi:hypothetical protein